MNTDRFRWWPWAAALVLLVVMAAMAPGSIGSILFTTFVMAGLGLSLQVVYGLLGELSLGHAALFGSGAYAFAVVADAVGPTGGFLIAVIVGALAGAVLALVTVRLEGAYFAIVTFALAAVLMIVVSGTRALGRDEGILGIESLPTVELLGRTNTHVVYAGIALMFALALLVLIRRSRLGLALETARIDPDLARSQGVHVGGLRVATTALSGLVAGLFGAMYAQQARFVSPDVFGLHFIIIPLAVVAVGGVRYNFGVLAGSIVVVTLPRLLDFPPVANQVFSGTVLVLVLLLLPQGLLGLGARMRARRSEKTEPAALPDADTPPLIDAERGADVE